MCIYDHCEAQKVEQAANQHWIDSVQRWKYIYYYQVKNSRYICFILHKGIAIINSDKNKRIAKVQKKRYEIGEQGNPV